MKKRLDIVLTEKGLTASRERARALIMGNRVEVDGVTVSKAGHRIYEDSYIKVKGNDNTYVSRGGLKLEYALDNFKISLNNKIAMDIGASTGGFTHCMLRRGVKKVYAVDVGYGQLSWQIRNNSRVVPVERTNIRYLGKENIPDMIDIATIDVSFISLKKVIPEVIKFMSKKGEIVALVKPQFEVGRDEVSKGGIVRDVEKRLKTVQFIKQFIEKSGLTVLESYESPVKGQKGNIEYFLYAWLENSG